MTIQEEIKNGEKLNLSQFRENNRYKAIRELIINAVIHRNYQMSSSVQVAVYDDRFGFKRIFAECDEYGVDRPEFLEIGDMLRVNFYRPSYKKNGDKAQKTAINSKSGDKNGDKLEKTAINQENGDKKSDKFRARILEYFGNHPNAKTQDISLEIGLKQSRTKVYLSELVEDGKIVANGANRNRTYSLK